MPVLKPLFEGPPVAEVHVWTASPELLRQEFPSAWAEPERARARTLTSPRRRESFRAGRAALRLALSLYRPVAPGDWVLAAEPGGRPVVAGPEPAARGLSVSLSHCDGLVACAVSSIREVGVDVERTGRTLRWRALAARFFHEREVEALRSLPEAEGRRAFFTLWTLKEAFLKARGSGRAGGLRAICFDGLGDPEPSAVFDAALRAASGERAEAWQFTRAEPSEAHVLAVAVRRGSTAKVAVRMGELPARCAWRPS